ncbi:ABC transporter permease [Lactobacillus sp. DCY120]|uniref:ABC transporter permease n=1 Tax=Bombilactobacillus apium TaxID=2675299 RepID=A0A850QZC0_9LACO|nr:ABC transporter permease [Bombilactobacillus apium]NVY96119.1 ABC transporter permease [Bombilactobacillus apium]
MNLIVSAIGQGLLWALLGLGLYLTFRILNFADMTVEGTFPMGAATAVVLITHGVSPLLASLAACGSGMLAGLVTGLLCTKGKIPSLLAGILTMTAAYSINLRIMGKSNISLLGQPTLFKHPVFQFLGQYFDAVTLGMVVIALVTIALIFFLNTDYGQSFIATGDNPKMAKSLGIKTDLIVIVGLVLSNGLVGLCGALVAQSNGYADINMGIGTIVIALASIIIGEVAFGELTLSQRLVAVTLGSIIYRLIIMAVLQLGFSPNDLNLISAFVLALCIMLPQLEKYVHLRKPLLAGGKKHD